eukprot:GEMP01014863.1.p2 GENE.GEMP01014863.1~~GEMP01014863.1.p2  ORF type:complete len:168 (-),score=23.76 GEMP01014863.1:640-1143(-)
MKPTSTANKFSQLSCSHFGYHANIKFAIVSPIALVQIQKGLHPTRSINSPAIGEHTAITTVTELAISPAATAGSSTESGKCDNRNGMTVTFKNGNALADTAHIQYVKAVTFCKEGLRLEGGGGADARNGDYGAHSESHFSIPEPESYKSQRRHVQTLSSKPEGELPH